MMKKTIEHVTKINCELREKGYDLDGINRFWNEIFSIAEKLDNGEAKKEDIRICTGCGHTVVDPSILCIKNCCDSVKYIHIFPSSETSHSLDTPHH